MYHLKSTITTPCFVLHEVYHHYCKSHDYICGMHCPQIITPISTFLKLNITLCEQSIMIMPALTLKTAPNGPKSCHSTASSVSGGRLYTKIHHPVPTTLPHGVEFASAASCTGEVLVPANVSFPHLRTSHQNRNYLFFNYIGPLPMLNSVSSLLLKNF